MTKLDICNIALLRLGQPAIVTIDEDTASAQALRNAWAHCLESFLLESKWNFSTTTANLSRLSGTPLTGFIYRYQLPSDFITVVTVNFNAGTQEGRWKIQGDQLHTDDETVTLEYVFRFADTGQFPAMICEALALLIASRCAETLTGSNSKTSMMTQEYVQIALPKARRLDASTGNRLTRPRYIESDLAASRFSER